MTQSFTTTNTRTRSYANVRYVKEKIASDLRYVREFYPSLYTVSDIENWSSDLYQWMYQGYADSVSVQFVANGKIVAEIRWDVKDDGSITDDDNVGRLRFKNLSGTTPRIIVPDSSAWTALSDSEKQKFYESLILDWGPVKRLDYADGSWRNDKRYSKGDFGVDRWVFGG